MIINSGDIGFHQKMNNTNKQLQKSIGKLASGKRITSASVDAAGLAISEKLRALQRGSRQALKNVQDAQSLVQTADSAMQEMTDVVQRIRELTIQAMNGTNTDIHHGSTGSVDTLLIQNEIDELKKNLRDIVKNTEFNTKKLLTNNVPGDYVYANRQISDIISAKVSASTNPAISGMNIVGSTAHTYTKEVEIETDTKQIEQTTTTYPPVDITMTTVVDHLPKWSADGTSIVFSSTRDGQTYRVPADGSSDTIVDSNTAIANLRQTVGDYKLEASGSTLMLKKRIGNSNSWVTQKSFQYNSSDGLHGYSFSPNIDPQGNTSFVFSDNSGNISRVDMNVRTGVIGEPVSLISTTDRLNLPPLNNTLTLPTKPDLYRMNTANASLVVKKATDSGMRVLDYWDGTGTPPSTGYYTITGNNITFHGDAIIGNEPGDDAQDVYSIQYVEGNGSMSFHSESIPSNAQLYNVNGESGPMSLRISVGGVEVGRDKFLSARPQDVENTTGIFIDKISGKVEFYGDLRPSAGQRIEISYLPDQDNDKNVQTHVLPEEIDTYNLDLNNPALPVPLEVYVGGRKIEYDGNKTNGYTYDPVTRKISLYGDSRPDIQKGERIEFKYVADKSQTSLDVFGISLGSAKPEIFNLGDSTKPNSIRVYRNGQEIDYSATDGFQYNSQTNTVELFGDSRPNIGDVYSVKMVTLPADPIKNDDKLEIPLVTKPEMYDPNSPDFPSSLKVTIAGKEIDYDENKQNGFYYNKSTNRIEVYGDSRPDADDFNKLSSPTISVKYATENSTVSLYNNSYDIPLQSGTSSYGLDGNGNVKGMLIYKDGVEIPYNEQNGFTFDPVTNRLSLHGSYRPTASDSQGAYRVYSVPESSLSTSVPSGSTVHNVTMNGNIIQPAADENGNGYLIEDGKVRLVGDARPNATFGRREYKLEVLYTEPISMELPVNPLVTGNTSYCNHETGSALPDAELVADSQIIKLNGQILTSDQYEINGNRISLITDKVTIMPGSNILAAEYEVRQGINYKDNTFVFQVGGNTGNQKAVNIASFDNFLMGMSAVCVRDAEDASKGLEIIDRSLNFILKELGNIGAAENSFDHIAANLHVSEEGLTNSLSLIEDTDMAKELMKSTKLQMLSKAQQALSGQAKQRQESVLKLLF